MNRLLARQLNYYLAERSDLQNEIKEFLVAVAAAYDHYENDIANLQHALEEAQQVAKGARRSKSEFLANMSHELRTPLNAIIGYSEMLADELQEGGEKEAMLEDVNKIHKAGKHLLALIAEILDLTHMESGKKDLNITTVDLPVFLAEIAAVAETFMQEKANLFEIRREESVTTIETDEAKLRQILLNLLNNAGKFTRQGKVTLSLSAVTKEGEPWIAFQVQDTGIGIQPDRIRQIFDYFSHANEWTDRLEGGVGIGLAITKKHSEALGGEISVQSESGKGSAFTVMLPAKQKVKT